MRKGSKRKRKIWESVPVIPVEYAEEIELPAWSFPHRDAEKYIEDVIALTLRGIRLQKSPDWEEDADDPTWDVGSDGDEHMTPAEREEAERQEMRDEQKQEAQYDAYEGMLREDIDGPENEGEDGLIEVDDRIKAARSALALGNADDLIRELEPIIDESDDELDEDVIVNWSFLLVDRSPAPRRKTPPPDDARSTLEVEVSAFSEKLCRSIAKDVAVLGALEWRDLERVVAHSLSGLGFEVELTPPSKDGGKDVIATCALMGKTVRYFVEIKHWRSGKRVDSNDIFDFVEVNASEQTEGSLFISTSGFTERAVSHLIELNHQRVQLGGKMKVVALCQHFVRNGRGLWRSPQTLPEILFELNYDR